jgi:hypothetical protein
MLATTEAQTYAARSDRPRGGGNVTDATVPEPGTPPPSTPPPMPAPQYAPAPATGPIGQPRSIGTSVLLAIVTFGIYTFVWTYKTYDEMKRHSGQGIGGAVGLILDIFVRPVTFFLVPSEIKGLYERDGRTTDLTPLWGLWFLLPLIGPVIWFIKVQGTLNEYWVSKGATPV